jgi:hypothetical protein
MPDTTVLTPVERRRAADRLWQVIAMCDAGRYVAFAMENPTWDGRESTPLNLEAANG